MTTHKRLTWKRIAVVAVGSLALGISGTAMALSTGEPADCVGGVPTVDDAGVTHLDINCSFAAPTVTVTVPVPGPTVTVPGPTFTETTTVTVTAPPSVSTTTVTVTPSPTKPPVTTPPATTPPPTTPPASGWPNAANTGVPANVVLTPWAGSCNITTPQTITGRTFACDVTISAAVNIVNSRINGTVSMGANGQLVMTDSEVNATPGAVRQVTGVENHDFTLTRVEVTGGNRGVYCARNCVIRDSFVHGQKIASTWHASAVRLEQHGQLLHSTVLCDAPATTQGGSCSADLTMYPDFAPIHHVTVDGNYFSPVVGGYWCAYGGATAGKPYSSAADNATFIVFRNNTFERGRFGRCGGFADGSAVTDFAANRTGNVWVSNVYDNGVAIQP